MKSMLPFFLIINLLSPASIHADQESFNDCILKYLKGSKQDVATHIIRQACNENFKNTAFLSEKQRAYNHCLLEHLQGVESIQAVMEIKAACMSKHK